MRIKQTFIFIVFSALILLSFSYNSIAYADDVFYVGGIPAGFTLFSKGASVLGLCDVVTDEGTVSPCKDAGILIGDKILYIDNNQTDTAQDIEKYVNNDLIKVLLIKRDDEELYVNVKPAKDINGKYRLGVFIRDDVTGIGTITYFKNNRFASLGHSVIDDNGGNLEIRGGNLCNCIITGTVRGEKGKPGELRGSFYKKNVIGRIDKNISEGVYGYLEENSIQDLTLEKIDLGQAKPGDAYIKTTIEGDKPKDYKISIIKVDSKQNIKNLVIKIKDRELLDQTGGILAGMSGSPIVQNGKLVGAVTHVFINDPTRGFGISIENMINN